jgi:hypothetical protein
MTIHARDAMPMFTATGVDGSLFRYEDIWQRKSLLLVSLRSDDPGAPAYATSIGALEPALAGLDAALVVTTMRIENVPSIGVVVADRWGEVYYVQEAGPASGLPSPAELLEWLRFVRNECPECQGETR